MAHGKVTAYLSIKGITLPLLTSHLENVEKKMDEVNHQVTKGIFSVFWFGKFSKFSKFSAFFLEITLNFEKDNLKNCHHVPKRNFLIKAHFFRLLVNTINIL